MQTVWYTRNGGPEALCHGALPDPEVGPQTVLIGVEAISLEGGDLLNRIHTPPTRVPHVPGYQAAGTVVAVGAQVT